MLVVAAVCIAAGTWQIERLIEKHDANDRLRANARLATVPVQAVLTASPSGGALDQGEQAQFRHVSATGTYGDEGQLLVRERTINGVVGYLVLTPFVTDQPGKPVLLVVRGFVAADGTHSPTISAATTGTVHITARVEPSENREDRFGGSGFGQIRAINVSSAAKRLGVAVFGGYAELLDGQPGTTGMTAIPDPDLSNPAGGAIEPQHLAYVVQWYLFAALALAAPLVMARVDSRRGDEPVRRSALRDALHAEAPTPTPSAGERARAANLADRYGSARRR